MNNSVPDWFVSLTFIFLAVIMLVFVIVVIIILITLCACAIAEECERLAHNRRLRRIEEDKAK